MKTHIFGASRMRLQALVFALSSAGVLLQACSAPVVRNPQPAWRIEPIMRTDSGLTGAQMAEASYQLGRYYDGQNRQAQAAENYRKALRLDPVHIEARNALGVLLARQGDFDSALVMLQEAVAMAPERIHILSNLGYAYLLAGREEDAIRTLNEAVRLDPANARASRNLEIVLARADKPSTPTQAVANLELADSLLERSLKLDKLGVSFVSAEQVQPAFAKEQPIVAMPAAATMTRNYRLELSNAMGVKGAARRLGKVLRSEGAPAAYLTDLKPFNQAKTQVEYARGYQPEAEHLANRLGATSVQKASLRSDGRDVRVVLGRDYVARLAALDDGSTPERFALAATVVALAR